MRGDKKKPKSKVVGPDASVGRFSAADRAKIDVHAKQLTAEELTLRDLRVARDLTQAQLAETLGLGRERVSRIEQRSDMLLSTLTSYVEAMGGSLKLVVVFPDREPVSIAGLSDVFDVPPAVLAKRPR